MHPDRKQQKEKAKTRKLWVL